VTSVCRGTVAFRGQGVKIQVMSLTKHKREMRRRRMSRGSSNLVELIFCEMSCILSFSAHCYAVSILIIVNEFDERCRQHWLLPASPECRSVSRPIISAAPDKSTNHVKLHCEQRFVPTSISVSSLAILQSRDNNVAQSRANIAQFSPE